MRVGFNISVPGLKKRRVDSPTSERQDSSPSRGTGMYFMGASLKITETYEIVFVTFNTIIIHVLPLLSAIFNYARN